MKRHPSSWSLLYAAPRAEARIFRRSSRSSIRPEAAPLTGISDTEIDALVARFGEPSDPVTRPDPPRVAVRPPPARSEVQLAKVIVRGELFARGLEAESPRRRRRDLDVTVASLRRSRRSPRVESCGTGSTVTEPVTVLSRTKRAGSMRVAMVMASVVLLFGLAFLLGVGLGVR